MENWFALTDSIIGVVSLSLQISALFIYKDWNPDKAGAGIFGGIYLTTFSLFIIKELRRSDIVYFCMAFLAALIGITYIVLYAWSIHLYREVIADCSSPILSLSKICDRAVIDSMMITCGILALIINGVIAGKMFAVIYKCKHTQNVSVHLYDIAMY